MPVNPLLFNIYADPLYSCIRKAEAESYSTNEFGYSLIQAYADNMILISDSEERLQKLISKSQDFFKFANIN
jgi:hypothetical protein